VERGPWATVIFVAGSGVASLVLNVAPIDPQYSWLRPEWPLLVLMYWIMKSPDDFNIGSGWFLGLLVDGVEGSPLGQHALALSIVSYLVLALHTRLSLFTPLQQSVAVLLLVAVYQLFSLWVQNVSGIPTGSLMFLWSCLTTALLWPIVRFCLDKSVR